MKVIAFVASPRKNGNSDILAEHFLEGAKSKGADTEKIYLYDHTINPCQGCYKNCWINPNDCTRFQDDMNQLISKMLSSDLILFVSPVYMSSYTSQLTVFFERCIPLMHVDLENDVLVENRGKGKNIVMALVHDAADLSTADIPFKAMEHVLKESYAEDLVRVWVHPGLFFKRTNIMDSRVFSYLLHLAIQQGVYVEYNIKYGLPPVNVQLQIPPQRKVLGVDGHSVKELKDLKGRSTSKEEALEK